MYTKYNKKIPVTTIKIIQAIEKAGYEAYIVGGCVRDLLMDREPNDWDITTSAKPEQIKAIFPRTYDTGIAHGTVTVIIEGDHYEVTTYRIEGEYKDFRRPEEVNFVEDITLDLARRDFTMNAIAYHPDRGFIDPYNGIEAIHQKSICSVRNAKERFSEDALRILRAVRFAAQLGFTIKQETIQGIKDCKELLQYISKERIRDEFLKICLSDRPCWIDKLYEWELLTYIMPEFIPCYTTSQNHPHHIYNVATHTIKVMENMPSTIMTRLSGLLHDIGKPMTHTTDQKGIDHFYNHPKKSAEIAKKVLKELRLDNQTIKDVTMLVSYHDYFIEHSITKEQIKRLLSIMDVELFQLLIALQLADAKAQNPSKLPRKLEALALQKQLLEEILMSKECYTKKMLAITGSELIEMGIPKGKEIGILLEKALMYVIQNPEKNTKEALLLFCQKQYKNKNKE